MRGLALIVDPATDERPVDRYRVEEFDGNGDALRAVLGGWLEPAPSHESVTVWCNEEGKDLGLPVNRLAMDVWIRWDVFQCMLIGRDWLAGNVVVTGGAGPDGETLDLPPEARAWILRVARDAGALIVADVWRTWNMLREDDPSPVKRIARDLQLPAADVARVVYPAETFGTWEPWQEPDLPDWNRFGLIDRTEDGPT